MDNYSWEEFEATLNTVARYGEVFNKADGGKNWDKVGGSSIYTTPWIDLYWHIENGEFNTLCEKLNELNLGKGESDIVIERLGKLIKEFEGVEPANEITNIKASIEAYSVGNLKEGLNDLLSKNITLHDFWTSGEPDKFVILRVNNYKCLSILKATYTNVIHSLQSQEAKEIMVLRTKVQEYEDSIKYLQSEMQSLKYENKRNVEDLVEIKSEKKELYDQNIELSKQIVELKSFRYKPEEDDDLPNTATFKMVLLYRLGLLEADIWPPATRDQIGRVIAKLIVEEKYKTIGKYKEHLNNGTIKGQTMLDSNEEAVETFLKGSFKDINLKKQKFIMLLEKKKK